MQPIFVALSLLWATTVAFQPLPATTTTSPRSTPRTTTTSLNIVPGDDNVSVLERVMDVFRNADISPPAFDAMVKANFPHALTNAQLETRVVATLAKKGFDASNTLLATSLCCDELARELEDDFVKVYGHNFNLGGLAGFPFAGNTGFGAMAAHIPDDGFCLILYGPHIGVSQEGVVGKVERTGIELVDSCCGSAIAASRYLQGITDGGATISTKIQQFSDFQQGAVQELILPHGKRLADAKNRILELPYALYESQDLLMQDIFRAGCHGTKKGTAVLGGVQINTSPNTPDYFHPLRFEYYNNKGEMLEDMLPGLANPSKEEQLLEELYALVAGTQYTGPAAPPNGAQHQLPAAINGFEG